MKTNSQPAPRFFQTVSTALAELKGELQRDYESAYPALREIIHLVLDEEETKAWELTTFPHLIFPDLVEAHIEKLNLQPVETHHHAPTERRERAELPMFQSALAYCSSC